MAWTESHQSLLTHRKTLALTAALKVNRYQVIGHLHGLWWWALDNVSSDGSLAGIEPEVIEQAAGWSSNGKAGIGFVDALKRAGFISDGALHNWWKYGGKLQEVREKDARRKRDARKDGAKTSSGHPEERRTDGAKTAHVEKSRVDKSTEEETRGDASAANARDAAAALLAKLHEDRIGTLNASRGDAIRDWAARLPEDQADAAATIRFAFDAMTSEADRPSWRFVEAVLERLESEGWPIDGPESEINDAGPED